jgi:hypothetical protein
LPQIRSRQRRGNSLRLRGSSQLRETEFLIADEECGMQGKK